MGVKHKLYRTDSTAVFCFVSFFSGMHVKGKSCNPDGKLKKVLDLIAKNKQYFFPNVLAVAGESRYKLRDPKANGGWGDKRDHDLCLGFFTNTTVSW